MAERPRVNLVGIVARIARAPAVEDGDAMAAEIALETLNFLDAECEESGCGPGPTAHLVVLDLCAALLAFNGVRSIEELVAWLRAELPARARELSKAIDAMVKLDELPPCSCRGTPEPGVWH